MKKLLFLPLVLFSLTPLAHADFPDVPATSEYHQAVSALEDLGVIKGYADGTFKLDQPVNRAEFLKMAYLAESKRDPKQQNKDESQLFPFGQESTIKVDPSCFSDLNGKEWFDPYVCWGKEKGLVKGYSNGEFKANQTVNAAEGAKMLVEVGNYYHTYAENGLDWALQADHWAAGYFHAFNGPIIPPSITTADQALTRGQVAEWVWRSSIATPEDLENKPARALAWDVKRFIPLDYIGPEIHQGPLKSYYAKDENKVYLVSVPDSAINEVDRADRKSFHLTQTKVGLTNKLGQIYHYIPIPIAVDDHFTFVAGKPIESSGGKTFEIIQASLFENTSTGGDGFYGKDSMRVYLMGCADGCGIYGMLPNSDAASFEALGQGYSKDKNNVYYLDKILVGIDAPTFSYDETLKKWKDKNGNYAEQDLYKMIPSQSALPKAGEQIVLIQTSLGDIKMRLFPELAPRAVENFVGLAKKGYYNGVIFHRVVPNFMIQTGDPTGTGMGGESLWGKNFGDELSSELTHIVGAVAMANRGPNTNGSQFFIVQAQATPWLDGMHTVFGQVFEGMDVVDKIANVERDVNDKPLEEVIVEKVEVTTY